MYTAPAYFACALNLFGALTLFFLFKETYAGIVEKAVVKDKDENVSFKGSAHPAKVQY